MAALWYVSPAEKLDLIYEPVSISQKAADMVRNRKLEVTVSEQELNSLLKMKLAQNPQLRPDVVIEGARFEQEQNEITAFVNIKYANRISIGATLTFSLEWKPPELIIHHESTYIKKRKVPASWLQLDPILIQAEEGMPPMVGIKDIRFEKDTILIALKLQAPF